MTCMYLFMCMTCMYVYVSEGVAGRSLFIHVFIYMLRPK